MKIFSLIITLLILTQSLTAETISVEYRSSPVEISNGNFKDYNLKESSVIKRLLYDQSESYLIVKLNDIYYHYCAVPAILVTDWVKADSLGKFYHSHVKNRFDCRIVLPPNY